MITEQRLIRTRTGEQFIVGYFLTPEQLEKLVQHFIVPDSLDERVLNIKKHVEQYLNNIDHE